MSTQIKNSSESSNQLANFTSSMDFMTLLSAGDVEKSLQEKLEALHSFGKSFERGYHYQCELNEKLKSHLEFKDKEYKLLEEELKSVKDKLNTMKTENRKLEDAYLLLLKERDQYKAECKKLKENLKQFSNPAVNKNSLSELATDKMVISECLLNDSPSSHTEISEEKRTTETPSVKLPTSQGQQKYLVSIEEQSKEEEDNSSLYTAGKANHHNTRKAGVGRQKPQAKSIKIARRGVLGAESPSYDEENLEASPTLRKELRENRNHAKAFSEGDEVISGSNSKMSLGEKTPNSRNLPSQKKLELETRISPLPSPKNLTSKSPVKKKVQVIKILGFDERRVEKLKNSVVSLKLKANKKHALAGKQTDSIFTFDSPTVHMDLANTVPVNNIQSPVLVKSKKPGEPNSELRMFEEFFIIGVDKADIEAFELENPGTKNGFLKPKILYNFPSVKTNLELPSRASVADFAFPFGVEIKSERIRSHSNLYEVMFPNNSHNDNSNCFVFPLLSGEIDDKFGQNCELLITINPDRFLYHICIKTSDFIDFGQEQTQNTISEFGSNPSGKRRRRRKIWKIAKVHCFMTFLPLIKLFMDVNCKLLMKPAVDILKIERLKLFSKLSAEQKDILEHTDGRWVSQFVEQELMKYLKDILAYPLPKLGSFFELKYKDFDRIATYIGDKKQAGLQAFSWAYPTVFSYFSFKDLWFIFSILLAERKMAILSKDLALLTSTLLVLHTMLKPFKYTYPSIFTLPEVLLSMCDVPGSGLFGINRGYDYLQQEGLNKTYSDCIFLVLGDQHPLLVADPNLLTGVIQPSFKNIEAKVSAHYTFFNKNTNSYLLNVNLSEAPTYKGSSPHFERSEKEIIRRRSSDLTSKSGDIENSLKILDHIQKALTNQIINCLPKNPIFVDKSTQELDYKAIGKCIIDQNPDEKLFLQEFALSQSFAYFVEKKYEDLMGLC